MSSRQGMSLRILRDMCGIYATPWSLGPNDEFVVASSSCPMDGGTVDVGGSNIFLFTDQAAITGSNPLDLEWVSGKRETVRLTDWRQG